MEMCSVLEKKVCNDEAQILKRFEGMISKVKKMMS